MNQYTDLYKSLSNSNLLAIINSVGDYQPLAIEAAKSELESRQLSSDELASANEEYKTKQIKEFAKIKKKQALENVVTTTIFSMGDIIKRPPTKRRVIIIICIIFSLMFLVQAFSLFGLVQYIFTNDNAVWDIPMAIYLLQSLLIPIGLLFLWLNKKIGWIVLSVYSVYSALYSIIYFFESLFVYYTGNRSIDNLYWRISFLPILFKILFFCGMLWAMCRSDVRSDYHINRLTLFITIGFAVSATALLYLSHSLI